MSTSYEVNPNFLWYLASRTVKGIPITRYIVSWYNSGGTDDYSLIVKWLKTLAINGQALSEEEVHLIASCAVNGMLELESSAKKFLDDNSDWIF